MRIIPPENDGFALVLLDFSFLNEPLFLYPDTLQQGLSRLVRQVLGYQFTLDSLLEDRLLEIFWKAGIENTQRFFFAPIFAERHIYAING